MVKMATTPKPEIKTYGHFSDNGREFVITCPTTPLPWVNFGFSKSMYAIFSATGGGYTVAGSAKEARLTKGALDERCLDNLGRYVYVADMDDRSFYSMTWQPTKTELDSFEARHGCGYTTIATAKAGLKHEITYFLTPHEDVEIWKIRLENTGTKTRNLRLFPYVAFVPGNELKGLTEAGNAYYFRYGQWDKDLEAVCAFNNVGLSFLPEEEQYKDDGCFGKVPVFFSTLKTEAYNCSRVKFLGQYNDESNPQELFYGAQLSNTDAMGAQLCAALQHSVSLKAGEVLEFHVCMVVADRNDLINNGKKETLQLAQKYRSKAAVDAAFEDLKKWYDAYFSIFQIQTPNVALNNHFNIWLKNQMRATLRASRDASRDHVGLFYGFGFRDKLQDLLETAMFDKDIAKEGIKEVMRQMFPDGMVYHNYFPLSKTGTITGHSDDVLWLPVTIYNYIRETGDFGFLSERVPFAVDPGQHPLDMSAYAKDSTVLDRLKLCIDTVWKKRSPRGIPLMLNGDWNDDLDQAGKEGKGESMMVASQLGVAINYTVEMLREIGGQEDLITEYQSRHTAVKDAMNTHCWEGDRYIRFVTDDGVAYGSKERSEGAVFINAMTWPILAGFADEDKVKILIATIERELETKCGPRLCAPCYTKSDAHIGGATREAPGKKENASVFMHPTTWHMLSLLHVGRGNMAYEKINKLLPWHLAADQNLFASEPYVHPEFVTGPDHSEFGRGGHSWLTGTAPWMHYFIGRMVGVETTLHGLIFKPCLNSQWTHFSAVRRYRGDEYRISVENPDHVESGVVSVTVDGRAIDPKTPLFVGDGKGHDVKVRMG